MTSKDAAQDIFKESSTQMRSRELYDLHIQQAAELRDGHVYGIKQTSALNECMYFHVLSNYSLDIMHDILEGVAQFELKLVLGYFILERNPPLLSLDDLNQHLASHDYGITETKNKPSFFKLDSGNSVGQKAMQAWCLIRHVPFIVAPEIEEDNAYWELLLKLLDIMDIIFSPQLTPGLIAQLSVLIEDHHAHFRETFPERRLLPKHHFMVHYPTCLRKIGPLIHVWCMRYEAKHEYFCRVADAVRNYKNICKSLAKRHQIMQTYRLLANKPLEVLEVGPGRQTEIIGLTDDCIHLVMEKIPMADFHTKVYDANWVKICGTKYQSSLFVCCDVQELPSFGRIIHILVHEDKVYFVLQVWETASYSRHYHAYIVRNEHPSYVVTEQSHLIDYQPLDILTDISEYNHNMYISPRHVLFK